MRVCLYYGWETRYNPNIRQNLIWIPEHQSALFLMGSTLILHKFAHPVQQKHIQLPLKPSIIKEDHNSILVSVGNTIKIYNFELVNTKCISNITGDIINDMGISKCGGYIIVISSDY